MLSEFPGVCGSFLIGPPYFLLKYIVVGDVCLWERTAPIIKMPGTKAHRQLLLISGSLGPCNARSEGPLSLDVAGFTRSQLMEEPLCKRQNLHPCQSSKVPEQKTESLSANIFIFMGDCTSIWSKCPEALRPATPNRGVHLITCALRTTSLLLEPDCRFSKTSL